MTARTRAELDAEIAGALATGSAKAKRPAKESHSDKAITTIAMMGTSPEQWHLTPIDWKDEERTITGLVRCPTCRGHKFVRIRAEVADPRFPTAADVIPPPLEAISTFDYDNAARRDAKASYGHYGNCPTCQTHTKRWGRVAQGKVPGPVRAIVRVGYPRFPPGTRFDSRFFGGLHCNLCNKLILQSGRVPVDATDARGIPHGMFVGEDCAKKFLDVKIKRPADSIMESGNAPAR